MIAQILVVILLVKGIEAKSIYNEREAKLLLSLSAGAYSSDPAKCVANTLPEWHKWMIYDTKDMQCDALRNLCSFYVIKSDRRKAIIVVFRGTTTTKQLFVEGMQTLRAKRDFFGVGKVNLYFFNAIETLWPNLEPLLRDTAFRKYQVIFTGHSLGGALASLAATRTVIQRLRTGDKIKLVTFGQPRTGDYSFAMYHNANIPRSFRVVNRFDSIPHLPPCKKDNRFYDSKNGNSRPCLVGEANSWYHHGIEIWYPDGMAENAKYRTCLNYPRSEDFTCSNSKKFNVLNCSTHVNDHKNYFGVKLDNFGQAGCIYQKNFALLKSSRFGQYIDALSEKFRNFKRPINDFFSNIKNTTMSKINVLRNRT